MSSLRNWIIPIRDLTKAEGRGSRSGDDRGSRASWNVIETEEIRRRGGDRGEKKRHEGEIEVGDRDH